MMRPDPLAAIGTLGRQLDTLCDPRVGIVTELIEVAIEPGSPRFFHYAAKASDTAAFVAQKNFSAAGGAATRREIALAKAVGEAVERYCAAIYDREALPLTSAREADFACVDPASFALHSDAQYATPGFPWAAFDRDTTIRWTPAIDVSSNAAIHVPAAFVWIPYTYLRGSGDSPIGQPISTGLAAHESRARAILSGLYEVVERDCFTITWQAGLAPPRVRIETLPDGAYDMVRRFEATGDTVVLLDLTLDNGIPCFLAVLTSEMHDRPARVFAASVDLDPARAIDKALEELAHTRRYSRQVDKYLPRVADTNDWEEVINQRDHLNFAADPANAALVDVILRSTERRSFSDYANQSHGVEADLVEATARIEATGHRVLACDLTSPDVAALGLHVWRVLIPGYHPLTMGHHIRALGGRRLFEVPQRLGQVAPAPGTDRNIPHPYP